ncbi:MAG TPA: thioredoxin domain-containing protein [Syntrophorhabdus sp.]|nr:thioredoxin domain-containing protein [Syntrophorhabdus sp.]
MRLKIGFIVTVLAVTVLFSGLSYAGESVFNRTVPVKGMVTMVDLGAGSCIPCKMMTPILEKLENRYKGKAEIIFIDLRYDRKQAERFQIQAIPTQVFFDKEGKEVARHVGFMSEDAIVEQLKKMGVNG